MTIDIEEYTQVLCPVRVNAVGKLQTMKGDLGKKSIHTSDSFLHSNYFSIMVNDYSINIAYMTICTFVTCR